MEPDGRKAFVLAGLPLLPKRMTDAAWESLLAGGLEETVQTIASICRELKTVDSAFFFSTARSAHSLPCAAPGFAHPDTAALPMDRFLRRSICQVLASGRPCYRPPKLQSLQAAKGEGPTASFMAIYLLLLGSRERPEGVLCAASSQFGGICRTSRKKLRHLSPFFTLLIENARLRKLLSAAAPPRAPAAPPAQPPADPVACLAHDLKNAMTTVSTFIQVLPAKWDDRHFRNTFYALARDETVRACSLIDTLLDKGRQRQARRKPVDFQAMLQELLAAKTPMADQRRLRFEIRGELTNPIICIERGAIEEAIVNLLTNAMEASPDGGSITFRLGGDALPNGRPAVRLEVQDEGPGIPPDLQPVIFAPYISTKTGLETWGGTGIGLTIARHHIEAHGGVIAFENPAGGGALFRVLLPLERRRQ